MRKLRSNLHQRGNGILVAVLAGVSPDTAPYSDIVRLTSPRLLVLCATSTNQEVLKLIRNDLPEPVVEYRRSGLAGLPDHAGTITIADISTFSRNEQDGLFYWISANPRASVVAFSPEPLWLRVLSQEFREDLFYRLNVCTILLDLPTDRGHGAVPGQAKSGSLPQSVINDENPGVRPP